MFNELMAKVDNFKHKHDRHANVSKTNEDKTSGASTLSVEDKVEDAHITTPPPDDAGSSTHPDQRISSLEKRQEIEDVKDYWHEALNSLSLGKQEALKSMGLDQLESGSVESSFNDLVAIVNERQKECERKFWRISVREKTIVLRNYTTSIIDWIEKTGDIAMPFAPTQIALS
ncbi:hypothetical protein N7493_011189 [Penicillium malachiteum]|uniref:Uncharacterized protein n=1 Tax=Penicillium malachiteum TaxID=1324776 RepID=A0AAD6HBN7_9EURO|nr:hypothetical protein N7493_011189 [Penicillium malachiteum]